MAADGTAATPVAELKPRLLHIEQMLSACLLADASALTARLNGLRRRLRGRGRRLRPAQIERTVRELEAALARSVAVRTARTAQAARLEFPSDLPFSAHAEAIGALLERHQVVIVCGATGCGKSTQLPKLCLHLGRGSGGRIGHTQPRRIAARAIARRLAEETATAPGALVGHCVRFDDNLAPTARVKLMTDGILLNEIHGDPWLEHYDTLIIDEVHERSLNVDFLIGYLRRVLAHRPDLKLILTSATIDAGIFANFYDDAAIYDIPSRAHPIEIRYRPPLGDDDDDLDVNDALLAAVQELDADDFGDILVFLPGEREIREAAQRLAQASLPTTEILMLFARLSAARQARIFAPGPQRRIILATNVAETSLTVPRVRHVIDSGLARISRYSPRRKLQQLPIERIAQANAEQRSGRCGRERPGICIRLYSEVDFGARRPHIEPEVQRTNLAGVMLKLMAMGIADIESFPFAEAPALRLIKDGYSILQEIGALNGARELTPLGGRMARFPIDPRLARALLAGSDLGCLRECLVIVAALSIADPRERPHEQRDSADRAHAEFQDKRSDFMWFLRAWPYARALQALPLKQQARQCRRRFLSAVRMREWVELHRYLSSSATAIGLVANPLAATYKQVQTALAAGFLSQIGQWQDNHYLGCRNGGFRLHPSSALARRPPPWVVAAEIVETRERYARIVGRIEPQWLERIAGEQLKRTYEAAHWDVRRGCVRATEIQRLYGLLVNHARLIDYARIEPDVARALFIDVGLLDGELGEDPEFMQHNTALITRVRALEERVRRRDLVATRTELHDFYEQRLPPGMCTRRDLLAWLRADATRMAQLCMHESAVTSAHFGAVAAWLFPDHLTIGGSQCPLVYRFEPGDPADGVSVTVPRILLPHLAHAGLDRLVPGLLSEKVAALLRALPKVQRRLVSPIREYAMACVEALVTVPGPLPMALASVLTRITGSAWSAAAFDDSRLEPHLRCRVVLIDATGTVLASARASDEMLREHEPAARAERAAVVWNVGGRSRGGWLFGTLDERVSTVGGGIEIRGYPALIDRGDAVELVVLDDAAAAASGLIHGVARLLWLDAGRELRQLARSLPRARAIELHAALFGYARPPLQLLALGLARRWCSTMTLPRDDLAYARMLAAFVERMPATVAALAEALGALFVRAVAVRAALARVPAMVRADIESQLGALVGPAALDHFDDAAIGRCQRALAAIDRRLERVESNPGKDLRKLALVLPWWQRYLGLTATRTATGPAAHVVHVLLEDYRISVFAPELGLANTVTTATLETALTALAAEA